MLPNEWGQAWVACAMWYPGKLQPLTDLGQTWVRLALPPPRPISESERQILEVLNVAHQSGLFASALRLLATNPFMSGYGMAWDHRAALREGRVGLLLTHF